jgi:hypothetical protein
MKKMLMCLAVAWVCQFGVWAQDTSPVATPPNDTPPDTTDSAARQLEELFHPRLHLLTQSYGDSVVLRWAPSNAPGWRVYNRIGYHVERALIDTSNKGPLRFERLTTAPLRPWTLEEWKSRSRPDQIFAAIAAQCLYGALSIPKPDGAQSMLDAATEFENRFGFALFAADCDAHAATGLGLRWVDRGVRKGQIWAYRVFPAYQDSIYVMDTAYAVVDVEPYRPWPPVQELSAESNDTVITLNWKNLPIGGYTGFNVYRRAGNGEWTKLNSSPVVAATPRGWTRKIEPWFTDTTARWGVEYTYQVRGINPFGEEGEPATITAALRDRTPPPLPMLKKPIVFSMTMVRLEWEIAPSNDLAGFFLLKSKYPDRDWRMIDTTLLPPTQRAYLDTLADPDFGYYTVIALDTAGNRSDFLPIFVDIHDTIPPAPPTGLRGTIDTNGVVRLEWNLGTERDLLGYRVLWANDSTHEFSQRTNLVLQDTVFYDTVAVNTLTEYVYYQVVAVDTRYFHSAPTPILALKRPDVVPPRAPVFTDVRSFIDRVILRWNPSTSSDVARHQLWRRTDSDTGWTLLAELPADADTYVDTTVVPRTRYHYTLEAVDRSGLRSERALPVQGRVSGETRWAEVSDVRARYDSTERAVVLEWSYPKPPAERYWFVVYRSVDDRPLVQYQAVEPTVLRFVDRKLVGRGVYRYAVRVMTVHGESGISQERTVEVR